MNQPRGDVDDDDGSCVGFVLFSMFAICWHTMDMVMMTMIMVDELEAI